MNGGSEGGLGREIILALVIERPGTAFELEKRLQRRFSSYGYARNIVRRTLGRLRASGLVVDRPPVCAAGATGREGMVWEATSAGVERSHAWVGEEISAPLARDELHAKIALCSEDDIPRLLEVLREAERDCEQRLAALSAQERARVAKSGANVAKSGANRWAVEMETIASDAELSWWENRALWLSRLKRQLEEANEQPDGSREEADG